MTTLKERFENKLGGRYCNGNCELYHCANVKKFFRQELLALAEEVEGKKVTKWNRFDDNSENNAMTNNDALDEAAALIRSKADELV